MVEFDVSPGRHWFGDCSVMYQLGFQDPATTTMEGIYLFNLHLLFIIISIVLLVGWLLVVVLKNFTELSNSNVAIFTHSNVIEVVWTSLPALILLSLASPSFSLLYSLDEISNPELTLKILGYSCSNSNTLKYSSYMLTNEFLKENSSIGFFRNLETNKRLILPTNTHLRLLVSAIDVLGRLDITDYSFRIIRMCFMSHSLW